MRSRAKLEELPVQRSKITEDGAADLSRVLGCGSILSLRENGIGPEGGAAMVDQLASAGGRKMRES